MFARASLVSRTCRYIFRANSVAVRPARPFSSLSSRAYAAVDAAMADTANTSGISAQSLKETLTKQLEAQYVEVEDMSGMSDLMRCDAMRCGLDLDLDRM